MNFIFVVRSKTFNISHDLNKIIGNNNNNNNESVWQLTRIFFWWRFEPFLFDGMIACENKWLNSCSVLHIFSDSLANTN